MLPNPGVFLSSAPNSELASMVLFFINSVTIYVIIHDLYFNFFLGGGGGGGLYQSIEQCFRAKEGVRVDLRDSKSI